jgi:hypothetical protein
MTESAPPDATLGGYLQEHGRPPAFEGSDGEAYSVSLEAERVPDLRASWEGYLVFLRWASTGTGITGHVETETLARGTSREAVFEAMGTLTLHSLRELLDQAILRRDSASVDAPAPSTPDPSDPS